MNQRLNTIAQSARIIQQWFVFFIFVMISVFMMLGCEPDESWNNPNSKGTIHRRLSPRYQRIWVTEQQTVRREIIPSHEMICYLDSNQQEQDRIVVWDYAPQRLYQILEYDAEQAVWQDSKPMQCLLVGIDQYKEDPLQFCCQDIQLFSRYMNEHFVEYQQPCHTTILLNQQATKVAVQAQLQQQIQRSDMYSTTMFVFSGHGHLQGLRLYDGEISIGQLQSYLLQTKSNRVLWIVDACYTRAILPGKSVYWAGNRAKGNSLLFPKPSRYPLAHFLVGRGKAVLFAAQQNEEARDGIFLHSLILHLEALEMNAHLPQLVQQVHLGILHHNKSSMAAERCTMTPWLQMQGDMQMVVIPWVK